MDIDNTDLRKKIKRCIMICLTLPSPTVANVIVNSTTACTVMAQRLMQLYAALPPQIDDDDTHSHITEWTNSRIENFAGWQDSFSSLSPDLQAFMQFMDWLHFCDAVSWKALPVISQALTTNVVRSLYLVVEPMLSQQAEQVALTTTIYITACIAQISAPVFLEGFVGFLVAGAAGDPETDAHKLSEILIARCDDMSDDLSAASLYLFCQLLSKKTEKVLNGLVLRHIQAYRPPDNAANEGDVLAASEKLLQQIPDHLKSADDESSFRMYFIDAQERASACASACQKWKTAGDISNVADASGECDSDTGMAEAAKVADTASTTMHFDPGNSVLATRTQDLAMQAIL